MHSTGRDVIKLYRVNGNRCVFNIVVSLQICFSNYSYHLISIIIIYIISRRIFLCLLGTIYVDLILNLSFQIYVLFLF